MNEYTGEFHDDHRWYQVFQNGEPFDHTPSLKFVNHSPSGFSWGYFGSGPAQLAFAILLEEIGEHVARRFYEAYKDDVIAKLKKDKWRITSNDVIGWVRENR
jgi:hypothetical protein